MPSFARRQFHDNETIDLNETLASFDTILDQMAGSSAKVRLDLAPEPLMASLDASQLELALLNLVRNAADALPAGGQILIRTGRRPASDTDAAASVEIAVIDDGTGMTPEVARRATDPFFTTKAVGKGTGLGLSMVKGFVDQSNGGLEITTALEHGTAVRLLFREVLP